MSTYLAVKDTASEGLIAPPVQRLELKSETPISYNEKGEVLSRFGDSFWNFSPISPSIKYISFDDKVFPRQIVEEMKILSYARIYWSPTTRSISSLRTTTLNAIGRWAVSNNKTITQTLNDPRLHNFLAASISNLKKREAESIASLVNELTKIRIAHPELTQAPANFELANLLRSTAEKLPDIEIKQTALIPSRIYAQIIKSFEEFLTDFNNHSQSIKEFFRITAAGLYDGGETHVSAQAFKKWYKKEGNYKKLIEDTNLSFIARKYNLQDKKRWNQYIRNVQCTAKYWVHLFTGMRDEEVNTLNRECLIKIKSKGTISKAISGYTSKTIGSGATATYWITSDIIDAGITAAQGCGEIFAIQNGWTLHPTDYPLFPAFNKLPGKGDAQLFHKNAPYVGGFSGQRHSEWLSLFPELIVTESDIAELVSFDGFRDWRSQIAVGEPWPLQTHQCRRSLAVYLARSGLVSLGTMQLQFKHLLTSMTSYYSRNSVFAKNFILNEPDNKSHQSQLNLIDDIQQELALSEFVQYQDKVVNNQNPLWGGEGTRIQRAKESGKPIAILTDRKKLEKAFIKGEMSFRVSPIGGCTHIGACDKLSPTNIGTPCLGCADFIGDEKSITKAEKALKLLYRTRDKYPIGSLHYLQTQADIEGFELKLNKAKAMA